MAELVVGVARHVEHAHVGAKIDEARRELAAAHLRHDDVAEQQVNVAGDAGGDRECVLAVVGVDDLVATAAQHVADQRADLDLVLDDEDPELPPTCVIVRGIGITCGAVLFTIAGR